MLSLFLDVHVRHVQALVQAILVAVYLATSFQSNMVETVRRRQNVN